MNSEKSFDLVAGEAWRVKAQNRATWQGLTSAWVAKVDCPWASGGQLALRADECELGRSAIRAAQLCEGVEP